MKRGLIDHPTPLVGPAAGFGKLVRGGEDRTLGAKPLREVFRPEDLRNNPAAFADPTATSAGATRRVVPEQRQNGGERWAVGLV